tara:strand:+ start:88 stop:426 length:339 start_codon:yes stop_codon:yes gene_type:complete
MDETMKILLQQVGVQMFIGNAERRGRRYGLSNNQVTQTLDSLSNYLFQLNQPNQSLNIEEAIAKIVTQLSAGKQADSKQIEANAEVQDSPPDITSVLAKLDDRLSNIESKIK